MKLRALLGIPAATLILTASAFSQTGPSTTIPPALGLVPVQLPGNLTDFIDDRDWAIALGKAFFWDMQAGSDGVTACASCHFQAGADVRSKNQLNPGQAHTAGGALANTFDPTETGGGGPNYQLRLADFPFFRLADPLDRNSEVLFDSNDVVGSQGVFARTFGFTAPGNVSDICDCEESLFHVGGVHARQTTGRNSPSAVNAIFNTRQFWDGRANMHFNGVNPFGLRDPDARVLKKIGEEVVPVQVDIVPASLASQAVGPPGSAVEMSCAGRTFPDIGQKLLRRRPLNLQRVDTRDSVLGGLARPNATGLRIGYDKLIQKAFKPEWWKAPKHQTEAGYSMMEANFSLYWGLSILLYESTLISSDSPFDRFRMGQFDALSADQQAGMALFFSSNIRCGNCHAGSEFTSATLSHQFPGGATGSTPNSLFIEDMIMGDGMQSHYDSGFYNIGVSPTEEDIGMGGRDPFGNPLSFIEQIIAKAKDGTEPVDPEADAVDPCALVGVPCIGINPDARVAVDGCFKTPTLRNIELTGPYFHNGTYGTLRSVVEFYNRGGNVRKVPEQGFFADTSGFEGVTSNLDELIRPLGLDDTQVDQMVEFLKSLTDERVRWERAPFDHPQLFVLSGVMGDELVVPPGDLCNEVLVGLDTFTELPAVGAGGRSDKGLPPLSSFEESLE